MTGTEERHDSQPSALVNKYRVTVSAQPCPSSREKMQLTGLTSQEQPLLPSINEATPFITITRGLYNYAATT